MRSNKLFLGVLVLFLSLRSDACANEQLRIEAESDQVARNQSLKIVDDADASGGKAVAIPGDLAADKELISFKLPVTTAGRYRVTMRLKAENIRDVGKAPRLNIREDNILKSYAVAYGLYLKGKSGYQDFSVPYDYRDTARKPVVSLHWTVGTGPERMDYGGTPALKMDHFDVVCLKTLSPLHIERVLPDRVRYLVNESGVVGITIKNYAQTEESCVLVVDLTHELEDSLPINNQPLKLRPGETRSLEVPLKITSGLYGYAAAVSLVQDGKEIDKVEAYFTVHNNPYAVTPAFGTSRDDEQPGGLANGYWGGCFSEIGHTDEELQRDIDVSHQEQDYTILKECGRMPGENLYAAPQEPIWIDGQANLLMSKRETQKMVTGLKRYGVACTLYLADFGGGWSSIELIKEHPDWFVYSSDSGDHEQNYNVSEAIKHQEFMENVDWNKFQQISPDSPTWKGTPNEWLEYVKYTRSLADKVRAFGFVGGFMPNYKLPEVVDHVADQIIASTRMFGWAGIRWDCGDLATGPMWGTYKPFIDFYGKPLAKTPEEMTEQTVTNLKRLKARVRKEFPNFVFGTNFGSWEEINRFPKLTEELCRDGGWMLNELSAWYNAPVSPYHYWDKYYAIHSDTAERITSLGGHYNPYPTSHEWPSPVDRLYALIFRLATKGHPGSLLYNSRLPGGNYPQFAVRFGRYLFDPNLRRVDKPEEIMNVKSPAPLWSDKSVQRLVEGQRESLIINLINPPVTKEIGTNSTDALPEPVNNPVVSVKIPAGKAKAKAWVVTAESWKLGELPKTQAVPLEVKIENNKAVVTVPQIIYWKMLVFQFK